MPDSLQTSVTFRIWSLLLKRHECMAIRRKNLIPRVLPSKDTQGRRKWHGSIGYLWLPINVTQQPWAYLVLFPRYCEIAAENCQFPNQPLFNVPPAEGVRLECVNALWFKDQKDGYTLPVKYFDDILSRLDTTHECDRQTDRQTDTERRLKYRVYA